MFLAMVVADDLELHPMDEKTGFLNGDQDENIFMPEPEGYIDDEKFYQFL